MANYGENFRGKKELILCPLCSKHLDGQQISFENCPVLKENIKITGNYSQIFNPSVPQELAIILVQIEKFREENNEKLSQQLRPTAPDNRPVFLGASDNLV